MKLNMQHRKASIADLSQIINLLLEDELGKDRETQSTSLDQRYIDAFNLINQDPNQYLMVVEKDDQIIATCHLTLMPSLTFMGSTRMQIEAVRVSEKLRGMKIGEWMINQASQYAKSKNVKIIQLTTNVQRPRAKTFYEKLGFKATHVGMKLYF
jgi:N-acetylglutamate synthase-like GNAT family acetyltransferase